MSLTSTIKQKHRGRKTRAWVYGGNLAAGISGSILGFNWGNPIGALIYGGLDIASHYFDQVRVHPLTRVAKLAGAVGWGLKSLYDVGNLFLGDVGSLIDLPFDLSMAYQLGVDSKDSYNKKYSLEEDLGTIRENVVDFFSEKVSDRGD